MADAMGLTLLLVPEHMAPDMRRYIATNGRVFVAPTHFTALNPSSQDFAP
jgi:hypothetical protein